MKRRILSFRIPPGHRYTVIGSMRRGWSGTQKFVHQKWPDKIFPIANFVFFLVQTKMSWRSVEITSRLQISFFLTMVTLVCGGGGSRGSNTPSSDGVRPF